MAAEGLGLAASVAGLVSLGLQITNGIVKYVDSTDARDEELEHIRRQNVILSTTLSAIQASSINLQASSINSQGQCPEFIAALEQSMQSCRNDLIAADALCTELADNGSIDWKSRLDNSKKKWTYAFRRSRIQQLADRLRQANETIQLILSGLGLEISRLNTDKLAALESSSQGYTSGLLLVRSEIAAVGTATSDISQRLPTLHSEVNNIAGLIAARSNDIEKTISDNHDAVQEELKNLRKLMIPRLAAKPSVLQQACHEFSGLNNPDTRAEPNNLSLLENDPALSEIGLRCICPQRRQSFQHTSWRFGGLHLSKSFYGRNHWPSCPLFKIQHENRRILNAKYIGLSAILGSALALTFTWTSGAGGFSISPTFTYYPTVDERMDPGFRIVAYIGGVCSYLRVKKSVEDEARRFLVQRAFEKLRQLFREAQAHPLATDTRNRGLMHQLALKTSFLPKTTNISLELTQTLLKYGVPAFSYDDNGWSPLAIALHQYGLPQNPHPRSQKAINVLMQANSEGQLAISGVTDWYISERNYLLVYSTWPEAAAACGCGPLSMAVIRSDIHEVTRLSRHPGSLAERDPICGFSPIHLAVTSPQILSILLQAEPNSVHRTSYRDITVLEAAMHLSSNNCVNGFSNVRCQRGCDCTQSIEIILASGGRPRMQEHSDSPVRLGALFRHASELARRRYVFEMKLLRDCELLISPTHLPEKETHNTRRGIEMPKAHDRVQGRNDADVYRWVYHEIEDLHYAKLFYRHGFRPSGILVDFLLRWYISYEHPSYLKWLVNHGGDCFQEISTKSPVSRRLSNTQISTAHLLFYHLGQIFSNRDIVLNEFDTMIIPRDARDTCQCHCSVGGCSPFLWLLKGFYDRRWTRQPTPIDVLVDSMRHYFGCCNPELTIMLYKAAIRWSTFEALDLTHTCCDPEVIRAQLGKTGGELDEDWLSRDDVDEINEEQGPLLELHEMLVDEFEREAAPFLVNANDASGSSCFPDFWSSIWSIRMEAECSKLDGSDLTDQEKKDAEELGVRWCEPLMEDEYVDSNPYAPWSTEYCLYQLDQICPEYNEPWPEWARRRPAHRGVSGAQRS